MSDPLMLTAQPFETIVRKEENKLRRTLARITELTKEYEVGVIVLGLPVTMDGSEKERARLTREFGEQVKARTGITPVYVDERLTTVSADEVLQETGIRREDRKKVIDQVAACLILKEYLEENGRKAGISD